MEELNDINNTIASAIEHGYFSGAFWELCGVRIGVNYPILLAISKLIRLGVTENNSPYFKLKISFEKEQ